MPSRYYAILAKYGIADETAPPPLVLARQGRPIYADVAQLLASMPNAPDSSLPVGTARIAHYLRYRIVSATRVSVTDITGKKYGYDVVLEDGKWRVELPPQVLQTLDRDLRR